jgi:hypothetical protein
MAPPSYAGLVTRLPRTFGPALNDQLRRWDLLFPAEQRQLRAQLDYLTGLSQAGLKELFAPMASLESRMDLPNWRPGAAGMSIEETGVLARSPLYPQWRTEVGKIFAQIEEAIEPSNRPGRVPRLILCVLPAGLPLNAQPMWPELAGQGSWVILSKPFRESENALVASLARRPASAGLEDIESTWVTECGRDLSASVESTGAIEFSWSALEAVRRTFLDRLNAIHRDLRSADQTTDDLRRLDISPSLDPRLGQIPRVREFIRSILLSGNGSLVFNNSFVQWSASEALRRVQPQALVACFGMRPKLKPFSSVVLFENQNRSNPTPDQDDPAGSLIDGQMLSQYVHYSARNLPVYQERLVTLFACADLPRVLVVGTKPGVAHFSSSASPLETQQLSDLALSWLAGN